MTICQTVRRPADDAGFVDFLAGYADVGGGRFNVPICNLEISAAAVGSNPLLRIVVFLGEAALVPGIINHCQGQTLLCDSIDSSFWHRS